ncbi:MAG: glycosyltransferase family 9 protein [Desulfonatronovibrio sp.]
MAKPILVLQMQRMGDLILSFPLFLWLRKTYPQRPIHVVAEKEFYKGLVGLSPEVLYIPWQGRAHVLKNEYFLLINLSHRPSAAWLAGRVKAGEKIGPYSGNDETLRVAGQWQLYRSSIVHNNRYNRFHWADLNALDVVDPGMIARTRWNAPAVRPGNRKIGIFIGASDKLKRPRSEFFALLCKELIRRQYQPVILGGPDEKALAGQVMKLCSVKLLNLTGKLSLSQLGALFKNLGLLITPDTGPMHLAAWMGLPILNLSLGPVNPWETGPYQPGHAIMRSSISCSGCWECIQKTPLCVDTFMVRQVVLLMERMLSRSRSGLEDVDFKAVNVFASGRRKGLYNLDPWKTRDSAATYLSLFWQSFWKYQFGLDKPAQFVNSARLLGKKYPFVMDKFRHSAIIFIAQLKSSIQKGRLPDSDFWKTSPPYFRPFVGYTHLMWQNQDYSTSSFSASIKMLQDLLDMLPDR